jgi:hypothetical protein
VPVELRFDSAQRRHPDELNRMFLYVLYEGFGGFYGRKAKWQALSDVPE